MVGRGRYFRYILAARGAGRLAVSDVLLSLADSSTSGSTRDPAGAKGGGHQVSCAGLP